MMATLQKFIQATACRHHRSTSIFGCKRLLWKKAISPHPRLLIEVHCRGLSTQGYQCLTLNSLIDFRKRIKRECIHNQLWIMRHSNNTYCHMNFPICSFTTCTQKNSKYDDITTTELHTQQSNVNNDSPSHANLPHTASSKSSSTCTNENTSSTVSSLNSSKARFKLPDPEIDWKYFTNPDNEIAIQTNIINRKGVGDIHKLRKLWNSLNYPEEIEAEVYHVELTQIKRSLMKEALDIPNFTHPDVPIGDETQNRLVEMVGTKRAFDFKPRTIGQLAENLGMLRTEMLGHTSGHKTYYLIGGLAQLEQALIHYTVDTLAQHGFTLVSVPDLIHPDIIERCGFKTTGDRNQVYKLDPDRHGQVALAGTGEMPIAGMFIGKVLEPKDLPKKIMTVSRCYRAETSDIEQEQGIYRVPHFTKVESFGLTTQEGGDASDELLAEVLDIQRSLFSALGLHFRILDMASQELGSPAYRKYDMEAWMPAKQFWGEISSTSNCIDYQSRRLCIKYRSDKSYTHVHTINGTACAIPRMIMAILENNQFENGRVEIPSVLHPYMDGQTILDKMDPPIIAKWIKSWNPTKKRPKSP